MRPPTDPSTLAPARGLPAPGGTHEAAFTLIEVIVACVLLAILSAVAIQAMFHSFGASAQLTSVSSGRARAAEASERIGADVRAARAFGRDGTALVDSADLKTALQANGALRDIDGSVMDWRDITKAAPDSLTFQSDIVDETVSRPECVTWSVVTQGGGWSLRRTVRAYTVGCGGGGGAVLEDDPMSDTNTVLPRPGTRGTPPLFSYAVARPAGSSCANRLVGGTVSAVDRNYITAVRIDFSPLLANGKNAARSTLKNEIALRSRTGADYLYAMGCDE